MTEHYICRIASPEEMARKWQYEIDRHTADRGNWVIWREEALRNRREGKTIPYYGFLEGNIICEATAVICPDVLKNSEGLVDSRTAYLEAFRTNEPYRGKGYFSRQFRFMLDDLRGRGYTRATLGVETDDGQNKAIYAHYGFTRHIRTENDSYPDGTVIRVAYYAKEMDE